MAMEKQQVGGSHTARIQDEFREQQFTLADASRLQSNQKWGSGGGHVGLCLPKHRKNLELLKVSCNFQFRAPPQGTQALAGNPVPLTEAEGPDSSTLLSMDPHLRRLPVLVRGPNWERSTMTPSREPRPRLKPHPNHQHNHVISLALAN